MPVPTPNNQQPKRRGAPRGNLNVLKTGRSSKQLKLLLQKLHADPEMLRLIIAFSQQQGFHDQSTRQAVRRYAGQIKRQKDREIQALRHGYEWLPSSEEGIHFAAILDSEAEEKRSPRKRRSASKGRN